MLSIQYIARTDRGEHTINFGALELVVFDGGGYVRTTAAWRLRGRAFAIVVAGQG